MEILPPLTLRLHGQRLVDFCYTGRLSSQIQAGRTHDSAILNSSTMSGVRDNRFDGYWRRGLDFSIKYVRAAARRYSAADHRTRG